MSDLDNAIDSINTAAIRTEIATDFIDTLSTADSSATVTNANNGETVGSFSKQIKDLYDEDGNSLAEYAAQAEAARDEAVAIVDGINPLKIAVIGDSISQITMGRNRPWPKILEEQVSITCDSVEVKDFAVGGANLLSAMTNPEFAGGTQVAAAIAYDPDMIIVALGFNDIFTANDDSATAIANLTSLLDYLEANCDARIEYVKQRCWDTGAFGEDLSSVTAMSNANVIPFLHEYINDDRVSNTDDYLALPLRGARITKLKYSNELHQYAENRALTDSRLNSSMTMNLYRTSRLGWHVDGLHPTESAHLYYASEVIRVLANRSSVYDNRLDGLITAANSSNLMEPDVFWATMVDAVDNGEDRRYTQRGDSTSFWMNYTQNDITQGFENWYMRPHRYLSWSLQQQCEDADSPVTFTLTGIPPEASANVSFWLESVQAWDSSRILYSDKTGSLNYTWIPSKIFPSWTGMPIGTPFTIGIRVQSALWQSYQYVDLFSELTISN